jgi:iron(III) transport system substrate-binding protein
MARYAPNRENALKLMEFLSGDEAQEMYAQLNGEFAVNPGIPLADAVAAWGEFIPDTAEMTEIAQYRTEASKMVDRVAYDE